MMKNQNDPKLGMLASRAFRKIYSSSLCPEKLHKILWKNWTVITPIYDRAVMVGNDPLLKDYVGCNGFWPIHDTL